MNTPEDRLRAMNLDLPSAARPVADYEAWSIVGSMLYTSGQLPWIDGNLLYTGKIGRELSPEQGYDACRLGALNGIAQLQAALGNLDRARIVRVEGVLNVAPGFIETPSVLNGASHLVNEVFGEKGRHSRMIHTNPELPLDCACLVYFWAEILS
jgi:enamine deaminase RidA (YjgF/YER057c/UK114 family)